MSLKYYLHVQMYMYHSDGVISSRNWVLITYFSTVLGLVQSSKRMVYPTSWPIITSSSSATRWATLIAATLLGWVQATHLRLSMRVSRHHWGICNAPFTSYESMSFIQLSNIMDLDNSSIILYLCILCDLFSVMWTVSMFAKCIFP